MLWVADLHLSAGAAMMGSMINGSFASISESEPFSLRLATASAKRLEGLIFCVILALAKVFSELVTFWVHDSSSGLWSKRLHVRQCVQSRV